MCIRDRSAGVAGSTEPDDRGIKPGYRTRGGEVWRSPAVDDAPGRRCVDRTGVRADHRGCEAFSVWQAGGELSGTSAARRFQWESAATGTHYQARELSLIHISEPTRLLSISYAVFCLKK